ncbi:helix-turn-helix transcriptional regulator [Paenibacillus sonchi]|uniref:Helix-turn-helix transcriptional regulator n=1 Tax=Paenibacillus sonchi TaxID=373687 RepID=A0A974P8H8_9BACL|nr:helix-turn-helix transcriptional regulator [Paenibacillus sonchi]QQZ58851.1 helix-turn-helix transcriptional regulator [Paenibacillus sonchi]
MNKTKSISELRESFCLSQKELAGILNISAKTLWNYEQDSSNLPNKILEKLMILFDIKYDHIFLGKKYEKNVQKRKEIFERAELVKKQFSA